MGDNGFVRLAEVKVSSQRSIVISRKQSEDKIIIAQRLQTIDEESKPVNFFLKGALNIPMTALVAVRDAINEAISILDDEGFI